MRKILFVSLIVVFAVILSVVALVSCAPPGAAANAASEQLHLARNVIWQLEYVSTTSDNQTVTPISDQWKDNYFLVRRNAYTGNVWSYFRVHCDVQYAQVVVSASLRNNLAPSTAVPVYIVFVSTYTQVGYVDDSGYIDIAVRVGEPEQGDFSSVYEIYDFQINVGTVPSDLYFRYMTENEYINYVSILGGIDYETGYQNGLQDNSMYEHERNVGYQLGWEAGHTAGYAYGYSQGMETSEGTTYNDVTGVNAVIGLLSGVNEALKVDIFGTFSIYDLLAMIVAIFLFFVFLRVFK